MKKYSTIIKFENRREIDKLYIHDTFINNIEINNKNKSVLIRIEGYKNRKYKLDIYGLVLLKCSYFNLWSSTDYKVIDIFLYEDDIDREISNIEKMENQRIQKSTDIIQPYMKYKGTRELMKIGIELDSGDIIQIICEQVIFYNLSSENALYDYN